MDFKFIAHQAGRETAGKLQSSEFFNSQIAGHEIPIAAERLDSITRGAVVLGVEAVDDPLTDGLIIYLQAAAGTFALFVDIDITEQRGGLYEVLRISRAEVA